MVILIEGRYKAMESTPYCTELRNYMINGCMYDIISLIVKIFKNSFYCVKKDDRR